MVFPGGAANFKSEDSGYGRAGSLLYDLVREAKEKNNTEVPILAICLGFEMLLYLDANNTNPLTRCNASSVADPLYLKPGKSNIYTVKFITVQFSNAHTHTNKYK